MKLTDAINEITADGAVSLTREEGKYVARLSSNHHVLRRFTDGYSVVHCARYMLDKGVVAKDAVKGDEFEQWWDERKVNNAKVGGASRTAWYKGRLALVEDLLALHTMDEIQDKLMEVRNECSTVLIYTQEEMTSNT